MKLFVIVRVEEDGKRSIDMSSDNREWLENVVKAFRYQYLTEKTGSRFFVKELDVDLSDPVSTATDMKKATKVENIAKCSITNSNPPTL
jgi:hypothetical protein